MQLGVLVIHIERGREGVQPLAFDRDGLGRFLIVVVELIVLPRLFQVVSVDFLKQMRYSTRGSQQLSRVLSSCHSCSVSYLQLGSYTFDG